MTKSKKIFSLFLACTIFFSVTLFSSPLKSNAAELTNTTFSNAHKVTKNYEVIKGKAKVQSKRSYNSPILGVLTKGDIVTSIDIIGNWCQINYEGDIGYVKMTRIKPVDPPIKPPVKPPLEESNKIKGIFSWSRSQALESSRADTYHWVDKLQINEIYQSGLFKIPTDERINFIRDLKNDKNVDVYELTGDPSYFNDISDYKRKIDLVKEHNNTVPDTAKLKGIVFDVEPWVLGDGNWTQEEYANTIKEAYIYAKSCNVNLVIVIPFWLDENISEIVIKNSDKTIVMNYNIAAPIKFIKEEITWAEKYTKPISTAAETQKKSSEHGVDDRTTYYYVGVDRMIEDWKAISSTYNYDGLEFSLHNFNSVKEFIK